MSVRGLEFSVQGKDTKIPSVDNKVLRTRNNFEVNKNLRRSGAKLYGQGVGTSKRTLKIVFSLSSAVNTILHVFAFKCFFLLDKNFMVYQKQKP